MTSRPFRASLIRISTLARLQRYGFQHCNLKTHQTQRPCQIVIGQKYVPTLSYKLIDQSSISDFNNNKMDEPEIHDSPCPVQKAYSMMPQMQIKFKASLDGTSSSYGAYIQEIEDFELETPKPKAKSKRSITVKQNFNKNQIHLPMSDQLNLSSHSINSRGSSCSSKKGILKSSSKSSVNNSQEPKSVSFILDQSIDKRLLQLK